jgi:hypothetical protein
MSDNKYAPIAQWIEQDRSKVLVGGSIPSGRAQQKILDLKSRIFFVVQLGN